MYRENTVNFVQNNWNYFILSLQRISRPFLNVGSDLHPYVIIVINFHHNLKGGFGNKIMIVDCHLKFTCSLKKLKYTHSKFILISKRCDEAICHNLYFPI